MHGEDEQQFTSWVDARASALRRAAFLICGDWHAADDAAQTTLTKLYLAWPRLTRRDDIDGYAWRVLTRSLTDEWRRPWRRREHPVEQLPDRAADDRTGQVDQQRLVLDALSGLPGRQRAALVLRFWQDLSVEQTAAALGCSVGAVKSHTSRGLHTLRVRLGDGFLIEQKGA
ncbi:SigE family RNA polymerase sigma factor [Micromonospora avicenniae]|uniref:RNA polymerase sigma-70 factor, sigma-E family n=1 Tax=Micromonospora avicenniae TaxID=1198245 RepID=A0A1N6SUS8_9ACTN|nr:SigE family RNA polymerase sigma factor [Micromonospora avicenniae]SIQ44767.1 RNA polymerase sigma-70 factor, sigma-E family [Micromonospora avicenniae]